MTYPDTTSKPTASSRLYASTGMDQTMLDWQVAAALSTVTPSDREFISKKNAARDRIHKLSCELWDARQEIAELRGPEKPDPLPDLIRAVLGVISTLENIGPEGKLVYVEEYHEVSRSARRALRLAIEKATS